jgi:hypothetical protein
MQYENTIGGNGGSLRQGRIAGDFLSSRKATRTERYTPKPSAAGLDRKLKLLPVFQSLETFVHFYECKLHANVVCL